MYTTSSVPLATSEANGKDHSLTTLLSLLTVLSSGSCASAKESMRIAVRFPVAADVRDLNLGLARSFAWGP